MTIVIALIILGVFATSWLLTSGVRKFALANQLLDVPNQRSSHTVPMPSGGGVAVVATWLGGAILLALVGRINGSMLLAVVPSTVLLAAVGFADDRFGLSPWLRLAAHFSSAAWFVLTSGDRALTGMAVIDDTPVLSMGLAISALVWLINLYNFMDGIDGLAAAEAICVALATALFCQLSGADDIATISFILAAACTGFLIWNWPPARIFMGDTGSSWVGFMLGALAITGSARTGSTIWPWVILLGVFLVDATVTLLRRLASRQNWYAAHRSHAYQILSRSWGGHRPVTLVVCLVNVGWIFPMATFAYFLPEFSWIIALAALAPLVAVVSWLGAGCSEKSAAADIIHE